MRKKILLLISILLLTGCDNSKLVDEDQVIKSYDDKFQITVPSNWKTVDKQGDLNDSANFEISNQRRQKYLIAITEAKEDLDMDFESYQDTIFSQNAENYSVDLNDRKDIKINGYPAKYVEFKTKYETSNIYMRIYAIESDNYYNQILIWTTYSQKDSVEQEFDEIINSFKEIK